MKRINIVAGNWKMNKTMIESAELTSEIVNMVSDEIQGDIEIILCPPFTSLSQVQTLTKNNPKITVGAQNCHQENSGAYTGEVSASMVKSTHADWVIIGHSERRQYFGENETILSAKINAAINHKLKVIYCVGETLEQRNSGIHFDIIRNQISGGLFHLDKEVTKNLVIAYEPVWAIGTGVTASSAQAQEVHAFIRNLIQENWGDAVADTMRILYGGSVKPENAKELFSCADIDGGLIGGAALQSRNFMDIIKAAL